MALSDQDSESSNPRPEEIDGQPQHEKTLGDDERLAALRTPETPVLPPVPEINFTRPLFGSTQDRRSFTTSSGSRIQLPESKSESAKAGAISAGAGIGAAATFGTSIVVGFTIGQWIDHKFGLERYGAPWGTIVMFCLGLAAGFINLFRLLTISEKNNKPGRDK